MAKAQARQFQCVSARTSVRAAGASGTPVRVAMLWVRRAHGSVSGTALTSR